MSAGSEAKYKDACVGIPEAGDWFSPIIVVAVGAAFFPRDEFAVGNKAGTAGTGNHIAIKFNEPVWTPGHR